MKVKETIKVVGTIIKEDFLSMPEVLVPFIKGVLFARNSILLGFAVAFFPIWIGFVVVEKFPWCLIALFGIFMFEIILIYYVIHIFKEFKLRKQKLEEKINQEEAEKEIVDNP